MEDHRVHRNPSEAQTQPVEHGDQARGSPLDPRLFEHSFIAISDAE